MNIYKTKYLKYKNKYLSLKYGGGKKYIDDLSRYVHNFLFIYNNKKKKKNLKNKTDNVVKKIIDSKDKKYEKIIQDKNKSDENKGKELLDLYYSLINKYEKKPDDLDIDEYKIEYFLYKYAVNTTTGRSRQGQDAHEVFNEQVKEYSKLLIDQKHFYEEEINKIINNNDMSIDDKGLALQLLSIKIKTNDFENNLLVNEQVSVRGNKCLSKCKYHNDKKNILASYLFGSSKKCQCYIDNKGTLENCEDKYCK